MIMKKILFIILFPISLYGQLIGSGPRKIQSAVTSGDIIGALGYTPVNPNGTGSQYIAGNGTKVTFPSIPADGGLVHIAGVETITGAKTLSATLTTAQISNGGSIIPTGNGLYALGTASLAFTTAFASNVSSPGNLTLVTSASGATVFRPTGGTNEYGRFSGTTGEFVLQTLGAAATNTGERLQVNGSAKITGSISAPGLPVYADNAAATTAGLPVNQFYRTPTGVVMVRY